MTRQEAIDLLDNLLGMVSDNHESDYDEAICMAIRSLGAWDLVMETLQKHQQIVLSGNESISKSARLSQIIWVIDIIRKHIQEVEE